MIQKRLSHFLVFAVYILISSAVYNGVIAQSETNKDITKTPNYKQQISLFKVYKPKNVKVVMLGNSLTHGANWYELLSRPYVVERGVPGDILKGFLARMKYVYELKPKYCFIMGGINDIYNWTPVKEIYQNYLKVIENLKRKGITPVIQSTLYAGKYYGKDWIEQNAPDINVVENNANRNEQVKKLNQLLKDYAKRNGIEFIDLNKRMAVNNFIRKELTYDSLHLNGKGYKIWADEIDKVLKKYGL
jgi:lysophospholipase L1-like esterase